MSKASVLKGKELKEWIFEVNNGCTSPMAQAIKQAHNLKNIYSITIWHKQDAATVIYHNKSQHHTEW